MSRKSYVSIGGVAQPAPAPRFSRTPGTVRSAPPARGEGGRQALADWGFDAAAIARLGESGLNQRG
jgi:alpha-methylacyl-CoA racemase